MLFAVQWLHVLGGIFWFGGTLFLNVVVIPAVIRLPLERQRDVGRSLSAQLGRIVAPVAMATILLGILRGTLFGPLKSLDALVGTAYGLTWLVGLIAALATMLWGARVTNPVVSALYENDAAWALGSEGRPPELAQRLTRRVMRVSLLELVGFFVIFTTMILMRFGL